VLLSEYKYTLKASTPISLDKGVLVTTYKKRAT